MIRVLMVCMGNICRSPMAEAVFAYQVAQAGLTAQISVDSAGTGSWHTGESAHPRTLELLRRKGIAYDGRARQIQRADLDEFSYVLAMDNDNLEYIHDLARGRTGGAEINLLLHYANRLGTVQDRIVPDPYYNGQYDRVYALVNPGCGALLHHIRQAHGL